MIRKKHESVSSASLSQSLSLSISASLSLCICLCFSLLALSSRYSSTFMPSSLIPLGLAAEPQSPYSIENRYSFRSSPHPQEIAPMIVRVWVQRNLLRYHTSKGSMESCPPTHCSIKYSLGYVASPSLPLTAWLPDDTILSIFLSSPSDHLFLEIQTGHPRSKNVASRPLEWAKSLIMLRWYSCTKQYWWVRC